MANWQRFILGEDLDPYISGVDFLANDDWFCFARALNLLEGVGVWITGTCLSGVATYEIGYEDLLTFNFVIDGAGQDLMTGTYGYIRNRSGPVNLLDVTLLADPTGSVAVDIWNSTYADFPHDDGDSICAAAIPAITQGLKYFDDTLTGWITGVAQGDILAYHVDSCTGIERVTITLGAVKTP